MTVLKFDFARYGAMAIAELRTEYERLVGAPPEKNNKPWMLKRMDQAFSARQAAQRAIASAAAPDEEGVPAVEATRTSDAEPEGELVETTPPASVALPIDPDDPAAALHVIVAPAESRAEPIAPPHVDALCDVAPPTAAVVSANVASTEDSSSLPTTEVDAPLSPGDVGGRLHRRYIPARFKAMSMEQLHALYLQTVGKRTRSVDVPYIAWKIALKERSGGQSPTASRRARRTGPGRGDAKAVTLRESADTLAAVEAVCSRHAFRNRLDFFRRAAHHFLEHLGESAAAAFFIDLVSNDEGGAASVGAVSAPS